MAQPPTTNIYYRNNTSTTNQPPQLLTNIKSTQIAAKKKKPTLERDKVKGGQRGEGRGWDRWRPRGEITCQTQTYHRLNPLSRSHNQAPPSTTKSTNHWPLLKPIYHHRWTQERDSPPWQTHLPPLMNLTLRPSQPISTKLRLPFLLSWPPLPPPPPSSVLPSSCSCLIVRRGRTWERETDSKKRENK